MNYDLMKDCFDTIKSKFHQTLKDTDIEAFNKSLDSIDGPTIVVGVGGSAVVGHFLTKVLREKKHQLTTFMMPRDLYYMDLSGYKNVIAVSYSGKNIGVDAVKHTNLNKYLFTGNHQDGFNNIIYNMPKEEAYVSISATMVPLSLLALYYQNDLTQIDKILDQDIKTNSNTYLYEVLSGYETLTAASMLESSITESRIGACVIHDKYNYCHGRINLSRMEKHDLIYFKDNTELDQLFQKLLYKHFNNVIEIERKYEDDIINDYYATFISLKLIQRIAENKNLDIANMIELKDNDYFYLFNGKVK